MAIIQVPKPPKSAWNPDRPLPTLVKSQVEQLYDAEKRLPHKYKSQIYINAIQTEGEAAEYIRKVTAAIHKAHEDAAAGRVKASPHPQSAKRGQIGGPAKRRSAIAIAAVAEMPRSARGATKTTAKRAKTQTKTKAKSSGAKAGRQR